jgi:hypothetical protein
LRANISKRTGAWGDRLGWKKGGKMRKMHSLELGVILGVLVFLVWPWDHSQAIRLKTTWADRVDQAQIVLRGVVVSVRSYWNQDRTMIYTENRISVQEYIKGSGPGEVTLTIPGGRVGDEALIVSDAPRFKVGEHVVLTLADSDRVVGGPDGVFRLTSAPDDMVKSANERDRLFLQWLRDYLEGKTKATFEDMTREKSEVEPSTKATITEVTPSVVSAGTGEAITIKGAGFGPAPGYPGPGIAFRYQGDEYYWDRSSVRSWSDSQVVMEVWAKDIDDYTYVPGSWNDTIGFQNSSGAIVATWPLTVKFGYGGARWNTAVVPYKLNVSSGPPGASEAIQRAASTWSNAGASFSFLYDGEITSCNYGPRNGLNEICFGPLSDDQTIGQASCWWSGSSMTECDILFNTKFVFSTDTPTPSGKMDLESIALHELGHWLSFTDLYGDLDREKVMYGYASYGGMKRDITEYDREGIRWIYGTSAPPSGPPQTPMPISPSGNIHTAYPTYSWSAVEGAASYVVYVSDSSQQGKINGEFSTSEANCSGGQTTCSVRPQVALRAGAGSWMVKAKNTFGESSWSSPLYFTVTGPDLAVRWDYGYQKCTYKGSGITCKVTSGLTAYNMGDISAPRTTVDVYLWDGEDFYWMKTVSIPALKPGAVKSKKVKFSYSCQGCSSLPDLYLVAEIDGDGIVAELDEDNNVDIWGPILPYGL